MKCDCSLFRDGHRVNPHGSWWRFAVVTSITLAFAGFPRLSNLSEVGAADGAGEAVDAPLVEGAAVAPAKDYRGGQVKMQLMSEVKSIRPGESFTVGLWIRHAPGWHTYWKNPGVVGVATTFMWDLPDGFKAGPVQWPAPQRTKMATLTAYGYEGECVLLMDLQAPAKLRPEDGPVTLRTKVGWMACATTCHPGWSDFELSLPVAKAGSTPRWNEPAHELFEAERGRFPESIEGWTFSAQRSGAAAEQDREPGQDQKFDWLELTLRPPQTLTQNEASLRSVADWGDVYFFSVDDQVDSDTPQDLRVNADGSLTLRMKRSQYSPDDPEMLAGVAFRADGWDSKPGGHPWMWVEAAW